MVPFIVLTSSALHPASGCKILVEIVLTDYGLVLGQLLLRTNQSQHVVNAAQLDLYFYAHVASSNVEMMIVVGFMVLSMFQKDTSCDLCH